MIRIDMEAKQAQFVKREQYLTAQLHQLTSQHKVYRQDTDQQLAMLTAEISRLHTALNAIYHSSSWRVTYPLRLVSRSVRRLLSAFRRTPQPPEPAPHQNQAAVAVFEALEPHHNQEEVEAVAPIAQPQEAIEWNNYPVSIRLNYEYLHRMGIAP